MKYSKVRTRNCLILIAMKLAASLRAGLEGRKAGIYCSKLNQRKNTLTGKEALIK
jgi:hypothetical protein